MNELQEIEKNNERVLLTSQLAESYGTTAKVITDNFSNNKGRYIEGKHFYCLKGDELREFKNQTENFGLVNKHSTTLYLWTQKGALLHAKSLNTDKAWEVYDYLIDNYFKKSNNNQIDIANALLNPDVIIQLATTLKEEQNKTKLLQNTINVQDEIIHQQDDILTEQQPKVEYHDEVLNKDDLMNISLIAKDLGVTAKELNKILHDNRVIFKQGSSWLVYAEYSWLIDEHYADYKSYNNDKYPPQLKWTEKGRKWIIKTFFNNTMPNMAFGKRSVY